MIIDLPVGTWVQRRYMNRNIVALISASTGIDKVLTYGPRPEPGQLVHEIVKQSDGSYKSKRSFRWKDPWSLI